LTLLFAWVSGLNGWSQSWEWAKKAAKSPNDLFGNENTGTDVAVDGSGNALFTGVFRGTVQFATTSLSTGNPLLAGKGGFVAKYSKTGEFQWAAKIDGEGGAGIATDAQGNAFVIGVANDQFIVTKYTASGTLAWVKVSSGTSVAAGNGIALDSQGNIFITGSFSRSLDFAGARVVSGDTRDVFVAKLSSSGNALWMARAGGEFHDEGRAIALDPVGNCYVTGIFQSDAKFGDQNLTSETDQNGIPTTDVFVAKYGSDGTVFWAKRLSGRDASGSATDDFGNGVAVDKAGNAYIAGSFGYSVASDNGTVFLRKYDGAGSVVWTKTAGGSGDDYANDVTVDTDGNAYIAGVFSSTALFDTKTLTSRGNSDIFITKYDKDGSVVWALKADGSGGFEFAYGMATDQNKAILLTGSFVGTVNFGSTVQIANNGSEIFLAKISQPSRPNEISLSDALDSSELTWATGGNADWFGQSRTSYDGRSAAQSGLLNKREESWMETTIVGPGTLTFRWKIAAVGFLEFTVNGFARGEISGDQDWAQKKYELPEGAQVLRWTHTKGIVALLDDASWVDDVKFVKFVPHGNNIAGQAPRGALTSPVALSRFDSTSPIDYALNTWVVIHGRDSDPNKANILALATALRDSLEKYQVLTLNWNEASRPILFDDFQGEDWIQPVAAWTASTLLASGFKGNRLNLIGHSWGALVADELAERIPGGVNVIVAIDPAQDVPNTPLSPGGSYNADRLNEIDFAAHSMFSWAFRSDRTGFDSGSQKTPVTADEAIVVKSSDHSLIVNLVANLIIDQGVGISKYFEIRRLLVHENGSWLLNSYNHDGVEKVGGGYEAVITADKNGTRAEALAYIPKSQLEAKLSGKILTLSWEDSAVALEEADEIAGPWRRVTTSTGKTSHDVTTTANRTFFRWRK